MTIEQLDYAQLEVTPIPQTASEDSDGFRRLLTNLRRDRAQVVAQPRTIESHRTRLRRGRENVRLEETWQMIRDLRIVPGIVVEYCGASYAVVELLLRGQALLVRLGQPRNRACVRLMRWDEENEVFEPTCSVLRHPREGFVHSESIQRAGSSLFGAHALEPLKKYVVKHLDPEDMYNDIDYGVFVRSAKVKSLVSEWTQKQGFQTEVPHGTPNGKTVPKKFCVTCGHERLTTTGRKQERRCLDCVQAERHVTHDGPRHCSRCGTSFRPIKKGARLWICDRTACISTQ